MRRKHHPGNQFDAPSVASAAPSRTPIRCPARASPRQNCEPRLLAERSQQQSFRTVLLLPEPGECATMRLLAKTSVHTRGRIRTVAQDPELNVATQPRRHESPMR